MRLTLLLSLLILSSLISVSKASDFNPDSLISEINYDYELTSGYNDDDSFWTLCLGSLSLKIEVPDSIEEIVFHRASGYFATHRDPPFYNSRRVIDINGKSIVDVIIPQVQPDSFFRVRFYTRNNSYWSSHYAINDLIDPQDLEWLHQTNSAIEIENEKPQIDIISGGISVSCKTQFTIEVVSLDGKSIFCGNVCNDTYIPLSKGIYIVRYCFNNKCVSKKVFIN